MKDKEWLEVILFDLGCLELVKSADNKYHYKLLKSNIKEFFRIKSKEK